MSKGLKILGIALAVLAIVIVALVVLVQVFVTPERIKAVLIPRAEEALQREVTLGDIEVGLIRGITLDRLTVHEKDGTEPFIAAEKVVLRFKIIPLLFRRVVVDEARLERPLIRVERLSEETFNFSDLLSARPAGTAPSQEPDGPPVDLLVSQVVIQNGELLFIDHAQGDSPLQYRLSAFDFSARDISLTEPFPWQAQGDLNGARLKAAGRIDPEAAQGEVDLEVSALDAALFAPYFRDALPGKLNAMQIHLNLSAQGGAQRVSSRGEIRLEGIDLLLEREGDEPLPLRNASLALDYDLEADLDNEVLALADSTVRFNGIPVVLAGKVENYATEPRLDMRLTLPELEVSSALAALPPEALPPLDDLDPSGKVSGWIDLNGPVAQAEKIVQRGEITLDRLSAALGEDRPFLSGLLRIGPGTLTSENLVAQMGENRAHIDLQVKNLFGDVIDVKSSLQADRFALDPLLGTAAGAAEPPPGSGAQGGPSASPEPLDLPLRAEGTVRIGQTVYKGLTMDDFHLQYRLEKNILTVQQITGKMVGGSFQGSARVDLGNPQPPFSAALELQGMQADPMVSAFLPSAAGTVFGTLNLQTQLEGRGAEADQIRRTLTGKGSVSIRDGQLTGEGLVQDLAAFLNLEELRVLRFSEAKGSFTARNGKLLLDSIIEGKDVRMNPQGTVGLENFALDLALNPRFSPALTNKLDSRGTLTQFLKDDQGWGRVPIRVAGTASQPRFTIDTSGVQKQLKEKAGEELRQQLQKGLDRLRPKEAPQESPPTEETPKRNPLEDALKGLFR